ncbi:MAG TPA: DUF3850 domain-containing protein [Candidatus Woesearchaeota archaeon]|nr:DUF3850 domain-containing protein [Candidatus Woesearchaeota archaeon]
MAVIEKKCTPYFFDLIVRGEKNVDLRLADFEIKPGDIFILKEWDPIRQHYTGRSETKFVKQVNKVDPFKFWDEDKLKKHGIFLIEF